MTDSAPHPSRGPAGGHPIDDRSLDDRLSWDLRLAVGMLARPIRKIYADDAAADGLTFTELSVLSRLERQGPSTSAALADSEQVTPQAIGTALGALARRGLVARAPDPADARRVITELTPAGRRTFHDRTHAVTEKIRQALGDALDPDERHLLAEAIPLLERLAARLADRG
jgi:DNA-binding MarR family transcriptional regulator